MPFDHYSFSCLVFVAVVTALALSIDKINHFITDCYLSIVALWMAKRCYVQWVYDSVFADECPTNSSVTALF